MMPRKYLQAFPSDDVSAAFLLACAGVFALTASVCVTGDWDHVAIPGLVVAGFAIVMSVAGLLQARRSWFVRATSAAARLPLRKLWFAALVLHAITAICMERAVTGTDIDTYTFQREACSRFLHGIDPYGGTEENIYSPADSARFYGPDVVKDGRVQVGLQYPPLTLWWVLPGYLLGDVRYSYVLAVMLAAWLLFKLGDSGAWVSLALLVNPLTFYIENRCYTEPLALLMLCATVYAAVKQRTWLFLVLGLFLASKQYNFLALPLLGFLLPKFSWNGLLKLTGKAVAVAVATVLPFAAWNVKALAHDTVWFHLAQPFRPDAVSFAVVWPVLLKVGPILWMALLGWMVYRAPKLPALFAGGFGVALLIFIATGKQAFANYYFLIGYALLLASAALPAAIKMRGCEEGFGTTQP